MENRLFFFLACLSLILPGCGGLSPDTQHQQLLITPLFTTDDVFKNPESVLFDSVTRQLFVANVNGHPLAKDGNGFISKVALNGDVRDLQWITGLNAPKGMTLIDDQLYIADIDQLVIVDITNNMKMFVPVKGAVFLNDVTHDDIGRVYISDFMNDTIHVYDQGQLTSWLHHKQLKFPNGLHVAGGKLYVGSWGQMVDGFKTEIPGRLLSIDLETREIYPESRELGNLDGVGRYGDIFILTDYMAGSLMLVDESGQLVQTIPLLPGSADLCVLPEDWELVVVPLMHDNRLQFFSITAKE